MSIIESLKDLSKLRQDGVLSEEEFNSQKQILLSENQDIVTTPIVPKKSTNGCITVAMVILFVLAGIAYWKIVIPGIILWFIWRHLTTSSLNKIMISIVLAVLAFCFIFDWDSIRPMPSKDTSVQPAMVSQEPMTVEEKIKSYINNKLGDKTNNKEDRIDSIYIQDDIVQITMNSDEGWDESDTKRTVIRKVMSVFGPEYSGQSPKSSIFDQDTSINTVIVSAKVKVLDVKGNESNIVQLLVRFDKGNYNSIKWDNFDFKNLATVANEYNEGEYFRNIY